jgi:hypothetical protein
MVTITGLTAARMLVIEGMSIVSGTVTGNNLILTRHNGQTVNAGNVRGTQGIQGVPGDISVSPAYGALSGNYPAPSLADSAVTGSKVHDGLKDSEQTQASLRSLGWGHKQAAAGDHQHAKLEDEGWKNFNAEEGAPPFGSAMNTVSRAQWRKVGSLVMVRISKEMSSAIDWNHKPGGNFDNRYVMGPGSVPDQATPDLDPVIGNARISDSPNTFLLNPNGSIVWSGGFPRSYSNNAMAHANFIFFTNK